MVVLSNMKIQRVYSHMNGLLGILQVLTQESVSIVQVRTHNELVGRVEVLRNQLVGMLQVLTQE